MNDCKPTLTPPYIFEKCFQIANSLKINIDFLELFSVSNGFVKLLEVEYLFGCFLFNMYQKKEILSRASRRKSRTLLCNWKLMIL